MADNTILNPGAGGDTIRDVDKGGLKTQVVMLDIGGAGAEALFTGAVTITSGAVTVSGVATAAKQDTGNTSLSSIDGKIVAVNTGAVVVSSGSITANAGTNLNTSLLALEAGGNLATIAGKDFATQATLSLVATAAKQDIGNASLATLASAVDSSGVSTTTPIGIPAFGLISDTVEKGYIDNELRPLSMNNSGRLRVSTYPADVEMEFFRTKSICAFDVPDLTDGGDPWSLGAASPFP